MKIKFHYSVSFGGEININTRTNYLYFKKNPVGLDISSVPKDIRKVFYEKKVELNDEIKKLISNSFDKYNIWNWPEDFNEVAGYGRIMDGDMWILKASHKEKKVYSHGQVYYPSTYKNLIAMFSKIFDVDFFKEIDDEMDIVDDDKN